MLPHREGVLIDLHHLAHPAENGDYLLVVIGEARGAAVADDIHPGIGGHSQPGGGMLLPAPLRHNPLVHGGDHQFQPLERLLRHIQPSGEIHDIRFHAPQHPHAVDIRGQDPQVEKMPEMGSVLNTVPWSVHPTASIPMAAACRATSVTVLYAWLEARV